MALLSRGGGPRVLFSEDFWLSHHFLASMRRAIRGVQSCRWHDGSMEIVGDQDSFVPLPWADRASSAPYLRGGAESQVHALEHILDELDRVQGRLDATIADFVGTSMSLAQAVVHLKTAGMVEHLDRDTVRPSEEITRWRGSGSTAVLIAALHGGTRFVGEFLVFLEDGPRLMQEVVEYARREYDLPWESFDQARRRLNWFRSTGLVEYATSKKLGLTEDGRHMASLLHLAPPDEALVPEARGQGVVELKGHEAGSGVSTRMRDLLDSMDSTSLRERASGLGYIPQGPEKLDIVNAVMALLDATKGGISREDYITFCASKFQIKESSFGATLSTLFRMGLVEESGFARYSPSSLGELWLEAPTPLNLVLILHTRLRYVLELVPALHEHSKAPALARLGRERFGFQRADVEGVRRRLQLLKAAGLIVERSNWRFQTSALGEQLAQEFPIEEGDFTPQSGTAFHEVEAEASHAESNPLAAALLEAGVHADEPIKLEQTVARALATLGFEAQLIGGSGNTDVLVTLTGPAHDPVRIIVDAKSARAGDVSENAVQFDTLKEHKLKHEASAIVIVGPGFDRGRIRDRADANGVRLLTTAELATTLERHDRTPLSAHLYLDLLMPEDRQSGRLEQAWKASENRLEVLQKVVEVLAHEAREPDEVTSGSLSQDQIYLMIRNDMDPRPTPGDITAALTLLEHDFIRAVSSTKGQYQLLDEPELIAAKLRMIARPLLQIEDVGKD